MAGDPLCGLFFNSLVSSNRLTSCRCPVHRKGIFYSTLFCYWNLRKTTAVHSLFLYNQSLSVILFFGKINIFNESYNSPIWLLNHVEFIPQSIFHIPGYFSISIAIFRRLFSSLDLFVGGIFGQHLFPLLYLRNS